MNKTNKQKTGPILVVVLILVFTLFITWKYSPKNTHALTTEETLLEIKKIDPMIVDVTEHRLGQQIILEFSLAPKDTPPESYLFKGSETIRDTLENLKQYFPNKKPAIIRFVFVEDWMNNSGDTDAVNIFALSFSGELLEKMQMKNLTGANILQNVTVENMVGSLAQRVIKAYCNDDNYSQGSGNFCKENIPPKDESQQDKIKNIETKT